MLELRGELQALEEEKWRGARVRSRAQYLAKGEKSTRFFFGLEQERQRSSFIEELVGEDGVRLSAPEAVRNEVFSFYSALFWPKWWMSSRPGPCWLG